MAVIDGIEVSGVTYDINATALSSPATIDGVPFSGSDSISRYGVCSTAAGTAAKVVPLGNNITLAAGTQVAVSFVYGNTASAPTLNVGGTGAKPIAARGTTNAGSYSWAAGETVIFWYDGAYWQQVGGSIGNATVAGKVRVDANPTSGSGNAVSSGSVYSELSAIKAVLPDVGSVTISDEDDGVTYKTTFAVQNGHLVAQMAAI